MKYWIRGLAAVALALSFVGMAQAAAALGPAALHARHASLAPQLAQNPFGGPVVLQSQEQSRRIEGDVYAVIDHPFATVQAALSDPGRWCEILILHLNTKYCRSHDANGARRVDLRVGKKHPQSLQAATPLSFRWQPAQVRGDYVSVQMDAAEGPYDTSDYRLLAEAVPLEGGRTLLHMGYAFSYGGASSLAMNLYLNTVGRDKVGFTLAGREYVGGMRGVAERNTMRYYLAIESYLASLQQPAGRRFASRIERWFDATEQYSRQLHEMKRDQYLAMKRGEYARQETVDLAANR